MRASVLERYSSLFRSSAASRRIAKQYLDWRMTDLPPLSVSHGVDFDHEEYPQDALNSEPIHWCYNQEIRARCSRLKAAFELPHPWLLLDRLLGERRPPANGRVLLVGPPSSATNDRRLARALDTAARSADAILVKERDDRSSERSWAYWEQRGVQPVSAGRLEGDHLRKLYDILTAYEHVLLPVFSSVGVLAAAVGCRVTPLRPYAHCSYSPRQLDLAPLVRSEKAQRVFRSFAHAPAAEATAYCREILGAPFFGTPAEKRAELERLVRELDTPVFVPSARRNRLKATVLMHAALLSGRVAFLKTGFRKAVRLKLLGTDDEVVWKRLDMFDALENGLSSRNYVTRPLRASERGARSGRGAEDDGD